MFATPLPPALGSSPNLVPQGPSETMHRTGITGQPQVADALEGRMGREGFLEKVTQEVTCQDIRLAPALTICPDVLCHLGPVLASASLRPPL